METKSSATGELTWRLPLGCRTYGVTFFAMEFTCDCCGITQTFPSAKEAFDEGWDVPPYFTGYVACSLCPGSFIAMGQTDRHNSIHARWEREGRPASGRGLSGLGH